LIRDIGRCAENYKTAAKLYEEEFPNTRHSIRITINLIYRTKQGELKKKTG